MQSRKGDCHPWRSMTGGRRPANPPARDPSRSRCRLPVLGVVNGVREAFHGCYGMTPCQHSCVRQHLWPLSAGLRRPSAQEWAAETTNDRRALRRVTLLFGDYHGFPLQRTHDGDSSGEWAVLESRVGSGRAVRIALPCRPFSRSCLRSFAVSTAPPQATSRFRSVPGRKLAFGHISCSHRGGRRVKPRKRGAFPISRSRAHTHRRHGHPLQTVPSAGLIERPQEKNRVDALR